MKMKHVFFLIVLVALAVSACQPKQVGPQISVEKVWGRTSPMAVSTGAFYMTIQNNGTEADRLLSATSTACMMAELHESYMMDNGAMGMRPVEGGVIEIPAGGTVELKVGGMHVMCMDKVADFNTGDKYEIVLKFEKTGEIVVEAEIKEQ